MLPSRCSSIEKSLDAVLKYWKYISIVNTDDFCSPTSSTDEKSQAILWESRVSLKHRQLTVQTLRCWRLLFVCFVRSYCFILCVYVWAWACVCVFRCLQRSKEVTGSHLWELELWRKVNLLMGAEEARNVNSGPTQKQWALLTTAHSTSSGPATLVFNSKNFWPAAVLDSYRPGPQIVGCAYVLIPVKLCNYLRLFGPFPLIGPLWVLQRALKHRNRHHTFD